MTGGPHRSAFLRRRWRRASRSPILPWGRVRRTVVGMTIALLGTGCVAPSTTDVPAVADTIEVLSSRPVHAGQGRSRLRDGARRLGSRPAADTGFRGGFLASPHPDRWRRMDGGVAGMSATWVDATKCGHAVRLLLPRRHGPVLSSLTESRRCRARPRTCSWTAGQRSWRGRPTATTWPGEGSCDVRGASTRWAYFVAAPGYGPVHEIGIPPRGSTWSWRSPPRGNGPSLPRPADPPHLVRRLVGRRSRRRLGGRVRALTREPQRGFRSTNGGRTTSATPRRPRMSTSTVSPVVATSAGPQVREADARLQQRRERPARDLTDQLVLGEHRVVGPRDVSALVHAQAHEPARQPLRRVDAAATSALGTRPCRTRRPTTTRPRGR